MDRALRIWDQCRRMLRRLGAQRKGPRQRYSDATIVLIELLAALHNQPVKWACRPEHWPGRLPPGGLPSPSAFSRRVRGGRVSSLRQRLEDFIRALDPAPADRVVTLTGDGHALPVARHSRDRGARFGRGAGGMAKGYKVHPLRDAEARVLGWRLSPMNADEGEMLRRVLACVPPGVQGYLLADASYDDNWLFAAARERGLRLVAPRRRPGSGLGHRHHDPDRLRSRDLLEPPLTHGPCFGRSLYALRAAIERQFGHWASTPELNPDLPAWVRGYTRVRRWVQCKIIAVMLDRLLRTKPHLLHAA